MSASAKKKAKSTKNKAPERKKAKVSQAKKVPKATAERKPKKPAPKAKKAAEVKEAAPKAVVKSVHVELGPPPVATVAVRHVDSDSLHERDARGFSFGELSSAGVALNAAKREGLNLDIRRRSVVEGNVELLKGWFKTPEHASVEDRQEKQVPVAATTKKK